MKKLFLHINIAQISLCFLLALVLFFICASSAYGQTTTIYTNEDAVFKQALELFQKQKYGSAQNLFTSVIKKRKSEDLVKADAQYYHAACAIELFNKDGELLLRNFIEQHPESPKIKLAYFYLGKNNFRKKKYKEALEWFKLVDVYHLPIEARYEFYFKRGYSFFEEKDFEKAKTDFFEIKDVDTKFTPAAVYYYAHISYNEKNYETAVQGFLKLLGSSEFGGVVPYYITQIYYLQEKYDDAIFFGTPLLDSSNTQRVHEIAKIIGESYFKTDRYKEAIPHFVRYEKAVGRLTQDDYYKIGFSYYKLNEIDNAIKYFQNATAGNEENITLQTALYHLGDCYIKKDKKKAAQSSFYAASKMDFDLQMQEDAMYSYAKLCYELSFNPFNEAIDAFKTYIINYPKSTRIDEAYNYLLNGYITTKNYGEAIKSIESIINPTEEFKHVYQKVTYYKAIDLYNNQQIDSAIKYFNKSLTERHDKNITAYCNYWKGECYYRKKNYPKAIEEYKLFIESPGAVNLSEFVLVNYNTAYCYFELKDYTNSNLWFRKYTNNTTVTDLKKLNDAYNRIGDSYFMIRNYDGAANAYGQAIKINLLDIDYAMYQRAMALGVEKKFEDKISSLQSILINFPNSTFAPPSKYELAKTYLVLGKENEALTYYKKLVSEYPNSSYVTKALSQIGLIYFNKQQDDESMKYFDMVIKRDRKSVEAMEALDFVKKIFIAKNDVEGMRKYYEDASVTISDGALDSISFEIGKKHYAERDCENAVKDFTKYLQKFSDGIFTLDASFYKAECEYKSGYLESALTGYNYIIQKQKNIFTESSLVSSASINFKLKKYTEAAANYAAIESQAEQQANIHNAKIALMRCYFELKRYNEAIAYSTKVLGLEKISTDISDEAHITIARSNMALEKYDDALVEYTSIAQNSKSDKGAEAIYEIAYIQFLKTEFKESEKTIFQLVNSDNASSYWITKGLILLADNYQAKNDLFQAKHTLKSVIENTDIEDLKKIAEQKFNSILELEQKQIPVLKAEDLKVEYKTNSLEYQNLFQEPAINDSIQK
ncbi:MAG: tetratricopeptide repeat protein [Bacteroidetes bacterium]|nr:tetratricopeptide repeat protein [Bacteroidota bacterium]